jgi:hypothetical protein
MLRTILCLSAATAAAAVANEKVISLFGSSVADGAYCHGNCSGLSTSKTVGGCYQSRLRMHQQSEPGEGRSVFNNCHGGDSTVKLLARFDQMLSCNPGYVFIGLSLANEGIRGANPQKIYDQYKNNMIQLVNQSRAHGIEPVIGLCYPNSDYTPSQYNYIKQMNLLLNTWDVPTANFLGAIDDGLGHWVDGYHVNSGHPNDAGSTEMYYSIVPSIFDAIKAGKKPNPKRASGAQFVTVNATGDLSVSQSEFVFSPDANQTIHAFAMQFGFRSTGDATLAVVQLQSGHTVKVAVTNNVVSYISSETPAPTPAPPASKCGTWCADHGDDPDECNCGVCGSFGGCTFSCDASKSTKKHHLVKCKPNGTASTASTATTPVSSGESGDNTWHEVVISHYYLNTSTNIYVDGVLRSQHRESLVPTSFALGVGATDGTTVDFQDWMIFRSALNQDEVAAMRATPKTVLQASLEVYAPLASTNPLQNEAQSMSVISNGATSWSEVSSTMVGTNQEAPDAGDAGDAGGSGAGVDLTASYGNTLAISYTWGPFNDGDCAKEQGNATVATGNGTRVVSCVTQEQPPAGPPLPPSLLSLFCNVSSDGTHLSAHYTMVDESSGSSQNAQDGPVVTSGCSFACSDVPNMGSCCF